MAFDAAHLDGVSESKLVVDVALFFISKLVVDDSKVDVGKEFASCVSYLLVLEMVLDSLFVELWVLGTKDLVVDSNAVVTQSLSMYIANHLTNLEELVLIEIYSLLVFSQVIAKHSR